MLASLAVAIGAMAPVSMDSFGPYDPRVPRPNQILGYEIGARHTVYHDQDRTTKAISAAAPARVRTLEYGKSTEGRPLRVFAISSPENIARLESIRKANLMLAEGKPVTEPVPAIVWINECIHGDETASFESAMQLIYTLAASQDPSVITALSQAVVIVNPAYNPDGHERYVVAYNSIPNGFTEPGAYDRAVPFAFFGRQNHYRFDMNRDRIAMSQAETRQEVALFRQWFPHVYVDQHGQVETYFFPPVQQSVNANVDRDRYNKWTEIFGRATAAAFDAYGWTYYIRDAFDLYNACYLDSHTTLMGSIGMTHETDGGRVMAGSREDGTVLTLRDGIVKHFVSAMAVIRSAAVERAALVESFAKFKQNAVSGEHAGDFRRVVLQSDDPRELQRLAEHLALSGIQSFFSGREYEQKNAVDYWSGEKSSVRVAPGALIVDMAQAQGPLAKALLEPNSDFEPDFIARQKRLAVALKEERRDYEIDNFEFYDSTAWALPYAYNVRAWWSKDTPAVSAGTASRSLRVPAVSSVGYYWRYQDREDALFAFKALSSGIRLGSNRRTIKLGGETLPPGTFFALASRNEPKELDSLRELAGLHEVRLESLQTSYPDSGRQGPGSESMTSLKKPKIGIVFGSAGSLSGGPLWYLLEQQWELPFVGLTSSALSGGLSDYSTLVVPGAGEDLSGNQNLQNWIRNGGCLVLIEPGSWAFGERGYEKLEETEIDPSLPGAFFRAELDPSSFLACGFTGAGGGSKLPIAMHIEGGSFYRAPKSGSAIALSKEKAGPRLLSGWTWDETASGLSGATMLHETGVGRGRVVMFTQDPTYRAQLPGQEKLLVNAILFGPTW